MTSNKLGPEPNEDFPEITPEMLATAVRGKTADVVRRGSNVVPIDEDLRELFPTERAVNDALRVLLPVVQAVPARDLPLCFSRERREQSPQYDVPRRTVVIHDDVTAVFRSPDAVNQALRVAAEVHRQLNMRRAG